MRICRTLPSEMVRFLWEMWNVLNRIKNEIHFFAIFIFLSYGHFCAQNDPSFRWFFTHNSNNKNGKKKLFSFSFYSAHSASGPVTTKDMQTPPLPSSEMVETLWKMRNVLNWRGKIIKKFSDFYFSSYRKISLKIGVMTS